MRIAFTTEKEVSPFKKLKKLQDSFIPLYQENMETSISTMIITVSNARLLAYQNAAYHMLKQQAINSGKEINDTRYPCQLKTKADIKERIETNITP